MLTVFNSCDNMHNDFDDDPNNGKTPCANRSFYTIVFHVFSAFLAIFLLGLYESLCEAFMPNELISQY